MGGDPSVVRSLAVRAEDVVMALEATRRGDDRTVLRVTPPFSARMRARIHVVHDDPGESSRDDSGESRRNRAGESTRDRPDESAGPATPDPGGVAADGSAGAAPIVVPPSDLVADPPPYPHPDETADALRADPDEEFTPERHRERHVAALEEWREAVRDSIVDTVELSHDGDAHEVAVKVLG